MTTSKFFVFDTNVLISVIFDFQSSSALALVRAREQGRLLISNGIEQEYLSVFSRSKFDKWISYKNRIDFIKNIIENSIPIVITRHIFVCRDAKDDMFLSLAVSGRANCIVSGDKDLLVLHSFSGLPILSPATFLDTF